MIFRDTLSCGHAQTVDVVAPIDPAWRIKRAEGGITLCFDCPKEHGATALRTVVLSTLREP